MSVQIPKRNPDLDLTVYACNLKDDKHNYATDFKEGSILLHKKTTKMTGSNPYAMNIRNLVQANAEMCYYCHENNLDKKSAFNLAHEYSFLGLCGTPLAKSYIPNLQPLKTSLRKTGYIEDIWHMRLEKGDPLYIRIRVFEVTTNTVLPVYHINEFTLLPPPEFKNNYYCVQFEACSGGMEEVNKDNFYLQVGICAENKNECFGGKRGKTVNTYTEITNYNIISNRQPLYACVSFS